MCIRDSRKGIIRSICFHSSLLLIIVKPSYLNFFFICTKNFIYRYLHQPRSLSCYIITDRPLDLEKGKQYLTLRKLSYLKKTRKYRKHNTYLYLYHPLPHFRVLPIATSTTKYIDLEKGKNHYLTLRNLFLLLPAQTLPDMKIVAEPKKIVIANKKAPKTRRYADAPLLNLKELLPPGVNCDDDSLKTTFRATRLEFIILVCEDDEDIDDDDLEWEIPDQDTFDEAIGMAVEVFTASDPDRITNLSWSSTGWDTGVGLVALTTDNLLMIKEFRTAIATIDLDLSLIHI